MSASKEYEQYVASVMQVLANARMDGVTVERDVRVEGTSTNHQVDVYWAFAVNGVKHRVIVNTKLYGRTVEKTDVLTLKGVLDDVPGASGMIATKRGFQSGAIEYAKHHNIALLIVREPEDEDYEGRIREIHLTLVLPHVELQGVHIERDEEWVAANLSAGDRDAADAPLSGKTSEMFIDDRAAGASATLQDLIAKAQKDEPKSDVALPVDYSHRFQWSDAMFRAPNRPAVRVKSLTVRWRVSEGEQREIVVRPTEATVVVRNVLEGYSLFVNTDGRLSGDLEDAGLKRR